MAYITQVQFLTTFHSITPTKVTILENNPRLKDQVTGSRKRIRDVEKFNAEIRANVTAKLESALTHPRGRRPDQRAL